MRVRAHPSHKGLIIGALAMRVRAHRSSAADSYIRCEKHAIVKSQNQNQNPAIIHIRTSHGQDHRVIERPNGMAGGRSKPEPYG